MANRYSVASGLASAPSTWDGGVSVPVSGDRVLISQNATGKNSLYTSNAGYAIGSTAITIGGTVAANSFVVGEAVQFPNDATYYNVTGWDSTTKVINISPALVVAIPAQGTIVYNKGHVVTLDGSYEWGDDTVNTVAINGINTTAGIFVTGTLKASRTSNSQLTCLGTLFVTTSAEASGVGTYDAGTLADPIPLGVSHSLILNKTAASPAAGKYGFETGASSTTMAKATFHGYSRKRNTRYVGALAAGATTCVVNDATGWQVGDQLVFAPTTSASSSDLVTISAITPGTGTTATITFPALTYPHAATAPVGNLSSNVTVSPYSWAQTGATYMRIQANYTLSTTLFDGWAHFQNVRFEYMGGSAASTAYKYGMLNLFPSAQKNNTSLPFDTVQSCAFSSTASTALAYQGAMVNALNYRQRIKLDDIAMYATSGAGGIGGNCIQEYNACILDWTNLVIYQGGQLVQSSYSQGGVNCTHTDCDFFGMNGAAVNYSCYNAFYKNCRFGPSGATYYVTATNTAALNFINCDFGYTFGAGVATYQTEWGISYGSGDITYTDCMFSSALADRVTSMANNTPATLLTYANKNTDIGQQSFHTPAGSAYRDAVTVKSGTSSVRLDPDANAKYAMTYAVKIPALNGKPLSLTGNLRFNAAYGSATLPSVTVSGLGIVPQTFTCANTPDVWQSQVFTITQNSGVDGYLDLTFSAASLNAGASAWMDGIPTGSFVSWVRVYGYQFHEAAIDRVADPIITQPNAAIVGAYTGIAIDTVAKKLTLTQDHSIHEVYDYVHWFLSQAANITAQEFLTSADGFNFACTYDLDLSNAQLTGSLAVGMAVNVLTLIGTGGSTLTITHSTGVLTAVKLTGMVAGTRVQLWDVAGNVELYNDVPGTSLTYPMTWTVDKSVRVRAMYADATTAKKFFETTATLYNTGLNLAIGQITDPVYAANGIDGSTVTGITISDTLMLLQISGGTLTWAQVYAYETYWLTTLAGIQDFARIIDAIDPANYILTSFKIKNVSSPSVPLVITGGYGRDSVTGQAGTLIDNTGGTIFCSPDNVISVKPNLTLNQFLALK